MTLTEATGLLEAAGVESPRFEATLLLALALGVSRTSVVAEISPPPTAEQAAEFARLIAERAKRVPLAYLRGTQEFYGLEFAVSPATLIPRPETEMLVEAVLRSDASRDSREPFLLADVGTGSGCIPISIAKWQKRVHAVAFDISPDALTIAQRNAARHNVSERVHFVQGNLLSGAAGEAFDAIVDRKSVV